jgi:hypothetical protein
MPSVGSSSGYGGCPTKRSYIFQPQAGERRTNRGTCEIIFSGASICHQQHMMVFVWSARDEARRMSRSSAGLKVGVQRWVRFHSSKNLNMCGFKAADQFSKVALLPRPQICFLLTELFPLQKRYPENITYSVIIPTCIV